MNAVVLVLCAIGIIALVLVAVSEDQGALRSVRRKFARKMIDDTERQNESALRDEPYGVYGEYMPPEELR